MYKEEVMQSYIFKKLLDYDGSQLQHTFAYKAANILGNSIVSFVGRTCVNDFISTNKMIHYVIELFDINATETILWQRVLVKVVVDELVANAFNVNGFYPGPLKYVFSPNKIHRKGDNVIVEDNDGQLLKLSTSITTLSCFSGLIYLGVNVDVEENCPVWAIGLTQMGYNNLGVRFFQEQTIKRFVVEYESVKKGTFKVQGA